MGFFYTKTLQEKEDLLWSFNVRSCCNLSKQRMQLKGELQSLPTKMRFVDRRCSASLCHCNQWWWMNQSIRCNTISSAPRAVRGSRCQCTWSTGVRRDENFRDPKEIASKIYTKDVRLGSTLNQGDSWRLEWLDPSEVGLHSNSTGSGMSADFIIIKVISGHHNSLR